jgi:hypothetical protein
MKGRIYAGLDLKTSWKDVTLENKARTGAYY